MMVTGSKGLMQKTRPTRSPLTPGRGSSFLCRATSWAAHVHAVGKHSAPSTYPSDQLSMERFSDSGANITRAGPPSVRVLWPWPVTSAAINASPLLHCRT